MTTLCAMSVPRAASVTIHVTSWRVLFALAPVIVLAGLLIAYCLVDLARTPTVRYLPKPVWALVILLVSVPFGALAYLLLGRNRHEAPRDVDGPDDAERSVDDHLRA